MNQRTSLIVAGALTAFVLVLVGALAARMVQLDTSASPTTVLQTTSVPQTQPQFQAQEATPVVAPAPAYAVSADQAGQIALDAATGAALTRTPELVDFQGTVAYEVLLDQGMLYVDANSGQVLHNGVTTMAAPASGGQITQAQAIQAASTYLGGGTASEVELDDEHGVLVYEVKFTNGSKVYVDAATGGVVYAQTRGDEHREAGEHYEAGEEEHDD